MMALKSPLSSGDVLTITDDIRYPKAFWEPGRGLPRQEIVLEIVDDRDVRISVDIPTGYLFIANRPVNPYDNTGLAGVSTQKSQEAFNDRFREYFQSSKDSCLSLFDSTRVASTDNKYEIVFFDKEVPDGFISLFDANSMRKYPEMLAIFGGRLPVYALRDACLSNDACGVVGGNDNRYCKISDVAALSSSYSNPGSYGIFNDDFWFVFGKTVKYTNSGVTGGGRREKLVHSAVPSPYIDPDKRWEKVWRVNNLFRFEKRDARTGKSYWEAPNERSSVLLNPAFRVPDTTEDTGGLYTNSALTASASYRGMRYDAPLRTVFERAVPVSDPNLTRLVRFEAYLPIGVDNLLLTDSTCTVNINPSLPIYCVVGDVLGSVIFKIVFGQPLGLDIGSYDVEGGVVLLDVSKKGSQSLQIVSGNHRIKAIVPAALSTDVDQALEPYFLQNRKETAFEEVARDGIYRYHCRDISILTNWIVIFS